MLRIGLLSLCLEQTYWGQVGRVGDGNQEYDTI
jgi:hypothetical protein